MTKHKQELNDLLTIIVENINEENRETVKLFIQEFIIPQLCEPEKKEELEIISKIPEKVSKKSIYKTRTGNGHKVKKIRGLSNSEKNIIRSEFIKLNGEIPEDVSLEIKGKLNKVITPFQVTGFITYLHKEVNKLGGIYKDYTKQDIVSLDMESYTKQLNKNRYETQRKTVIFAEPKITIPVITFTYADPKTIMGGKYAEKV